MKMLLTTDIMNTFTDTLRASLMPLYILLGIIVFVMIAVGVVLFIIRKKEYEKSTYYHEKKIKYIKLLFSKGDHGEYLLFKNLRKFEKDGAKYIFGAYLPAKNGEDTEVDIVMIYKTGIYVIECKNYSGWIYGNEKDKMWTETFPKTKNKFYNPILQNKGHLMALNNIIDMEEKCFSIIAFSDECTLKNVTVSDTKTKVIQYKNIRNTVKQNKMEILTETQINEIYEKLYTYTQVSDEVKKKHILDVKKKQ